ncbi:crotonase/enoyl-CoA hydratase family protein [Planktotalea sp.]|uniref:crotonase/enoyl-CoA hydratase family protein n=1 Tax=Planktotalea sp. TaxID=2029877 RepID=UPI0025CC203E|nr:crotonase/enoyl-CoA hydratase family protein [Planktotalea sp.]
MSRVTTTITDHVAHVELSRPDKMNAVDPDMLKGIIDAGEALRGNTDVRAVVLSGQGGAFCAGLDVASFAVLAGGDPMELMMRRTHGPSNDYQHVAMVWKQLEMPVIAALHGVCFGAGLQIASGADIRIAAPETRMSILEMKWGLVPDMGGMAIWPDLMRADVLRRLTYTGEEFTGAQGQDYGLVTDLSETPLETALALAKLIATKSPSAVRTGKALISYALANDQDAILLEESRAQASLIGKRDQMEAVMANIQKRSPKFG